MCARMPNCGGLKTVSYACDSSIPGFKLSSQYSNLLGLVLSWALTLHQLCVRDLLRQIIIHLIWMERKGTLKHLTCDIMYCTTRATEADSPVSTEEMMRKDSTLTSKQICGSLMMNSKNICSRKSFYFQKKSTSV